MTHNTKDWEKNFNPLKFQDFADGRWYTNVEKLKAYIHQELQKAREDAQAEYKQFVLNVLDGVDIADGQCNTKAIRFALQSRTIQSELDQHTEEIPGFKGTMEALDKLKI